jgi:hypothetical protein
VGAGLFGLARQVHGVGGVVGADRRDDGGPVADGVDHDTHQLGLLVIGRGGRLTGGAVEHDAVVAQVDEVAG